LQSVEDLRKRSTRDHISAVIVLSDGKDHGSHLTLGQARDQLREISGEEIRIFTIAYTEDAAGASGALQQLADDTHGTAYTGTLDTIKAVYERISKFF
jgi:hypothetical protein